MDSNQIINLTEYSTIKLLEETIGENLYDFGLGKDFLYMTLKVLKIMTVSEWKISALQKTLSSYRLGDIFANSMFNKAFASRIWQEVSILNNKK